MFSGIIPPDKMPPDRQHFVRGNYVRGIWCPGAFSPLLTTRGRIHQWDVGSRWSFLSFSLWPTDFLDFTIRQKATFWNALSTWLKSWIHPGSLITQSAWSTCCRAYSVHDPLCTLVYSYRLAHDSNIYTHSLEADYCSTHAIYVSCCNRIISGPWL